MEVSLASDIITENNKNSAVADQSKHLNPKKLMQG